MTSIASSTVSATPAVAAGLGSGRLLGLGNVLRKDVREWLRGRRFWTVLVIATLVAVLTAANAWISDYLRTAFPAGPGEVPPDPLPMTPMANVLAPLATQFHILAAIFATMSLIVAEREGGTLAWTISKPVSRTSVLLGKWISATALIWVAAVAIPLLAVLGVVVVLYGQPDLGVVAVLGAGLVTVVAFYTAVTLTAATFLPSQAGVAAVGLAVFLVPSLVVGLYPPIAAVLPTAMGNWIAGLAIGMAGSVLTPLAWFIALGVLFVLARARFAATEL
jgi:ABC-type transport system involved in multi-copper enzyme maturation permease subunit